MLPSDVDCVELTEAGPRKSGNMLSILMNRCSTYFRQLAMFVCGECHEKRLHPRRQASIRGAKRAQEWFEKHCVELGYLSCLAQSLDLNII